MDIRVKTFRFSSCYSTNMFNYPQKKSYGMLKVRETESDMVIQIVFGVLEQGVHDNCMIPSGLLCKKEFL